MRTRLLRSIGVTTTIASVSAIAGLVFMQQSSVAVAAEPNPNTTLRTPWGAPDLQGKWTVESDTPLQRAPKYANQEFFSATQRKELDDERLALLRRDRRVERGTELDVAGAYNALFMSQKR